ANRGELLPLNKKTKATPAAPIRRRRGVAAVTEAAILEAAIPEFASHGYDAVSMRTIADIAGVTPPSIYLYFKDKRTLYEAACLHSFSRQTAGIFAAVNEGATPAERLRGFVRGTARGLIADPTTARLFQRELVQGRSRGL